MQGLQPELRGRERESVQSCPGIHHQALGGFCGSCFSDGGGCRGMLGSHPTLSGGLDPHAGCWTCPPCAIHLPQVPWSQHSNSVPTGKGLRTENYEQEPEPRWPSSKHSQRRGDRPPFEPSSRKIRKTICSSPTSIPPLRSLQQPGPPLSEQPNPLSGTT